MRRFYGVLLLTTLALACSSSDDPTFGANATSSVTSTSSGGECVPGQQIACACGGGVEGFQTCDAAGAGYGACSCDGAGGAGGGASGTGGAGGDGGTAPCTPNATVPCYEGPAGTEDKGICVGGTKTCAADGSDYGPCMGQVLPSAEMCGTPGDDDCDGQANEEGPDCTCVPGSTTSCYSGAANTEDVGLCHGGLQLCNADGMGYGACGGEVLPQSDDCNTPVDENCDGVNASCNVGLCLWSKVFGGNATPESTVIDAAGNILMAGMYEGTPDFGGADLPSANRGFFVTKLDLSGNHLWSHGFLGFSIVTAYGMTTDAAGNVFVAAGYTSGIPDLGGGPLTNQSSDGGFVVKYDAAGNHVWSKAYKGDVECRGIALDASGNVFVTGGSQGTVDFGGGPLVAPSASEYSMFGMKLDAAGQHVWSKMFGVTTGQEGYAAAVDAAGNVWFTGSAYGTIDFGGGALTSPVWGVALAKLTTNGSHLYSALWGDGAGTSVAVDPAGDVVLAGYFEDTIDFGGGPLTSAGGNDFFVAKLHGNGSYAWSKRFGNPVSQVGIEADVNAAGEILLGGYLIGSADFGGGALSEAGGIDVFLAKLDSLGNHVYSKAFGDNGGQQGHAVALDDTGAAVVTGYMFSTLDFGCGTLTGQAQATAFAAKLSP